ncbi:MAG: hydrogenase formation protein HypD [Spirochaetales bacterium]|nr:MAG: hydrogenase formation protein HypD [Spirochaetales bacterium]
MKTASLEETGKLAADFTKGISGYAKSIDREIVIMEVCGTHTVALRKHGIHSLLPRNIRLVSGPGCPVCVTPASFIGNSLELLENDKSVHIATFGDMAKVPDDKGRTLSGYTGTGRVRIVYSPADLIALCAETDGEVVFLGIGFETTIPAVASTLLRAKKTGLANLSVYACFKQVPPALLALLSNPACDLDALLLPGHVSAILGLAPYQFIVENWHMPAVVAGFEGLDLLSAIFMIVRQLASGRGTVENAYGRAVRNEGNVKALAIMREVFSPVTSLWRGLGTIPLSGLGLNNDFARFDAERRFELPPLTDTEQDGCMCAEVIQGKTQPRDCPFYGSRCTPDRPVGPCMVSSEGACAAWFFYGDAPI